MWRRFYEKEEVVAGYQIKNGVLVMVFTRMFHWRKRLLALVKLIYPESGSFLLQKLFLFLVLVLVHVCLVFDGYVLHVMVMVFLACGFDESRNGHLDLIWYDRHDAMLLMR